MKLRLQYDSKGNPFTEITCHYQLQIWKSSLPEQIEQAKKILIEASGLQPIETEISLFAYFDGKDRAELVCDDFPLGITYQITAGTYYVSTLIIPNTALLEWINEAQQRIQQHKEQ